MVRVGLVFFSFFERSLSSFKAAIIFVYSTNNKKKSIYLNIIIYVYFPPQWHVMQKYLVSQYNREQEFLGKKGC